MTIKVKCQLSEKEGNDAAHVRVRVIKAPVVDNNDLRHVIFARARALIL